MTDLITICKTRYLDLVKDCILLCKTILKQSDKHTTAEVEKAASTLRKIEIACSMYTNSGIPSEREDWKPIYDLLRK